MLRGNMPSASSTLRSLEELMEMAPTQHIDIPGALDDVA